MKRPGRWELIRDLIIALTPTERAKVRALLAPAPFTGGPLRGEGWIVVSELGCVSPEGRAYVAEWMRRYVSHDGDLPDDVSTETLLAAHRRASEASTRR